MYFRRSCSRHVPPCSEGEVYALIRAPELKVLNGHHHYQGITQHATDGHLLLSAAHVLFEQGLRTRLLPCFRRIDRDDDDADVNDVILANIVTVSSTHVL